MEFNEFSQNILMNFCDSLKAWHLIYDLCIEHAIVHIHLVQIHINFVMISGRLMLKYGPARILPLLKRIDQG